MTSSCISMLVVKRVNHKITNTIRSPLCSSLLAVPVVCMILLFRARLTPFEVRACNKVRLSKQVQTDKPEKKFASRYRQTLIQARRVDHANLHCRSFLKLWQLVDHAMETLSALLVFFMHNPPVTGGFPSQKSNSFGFEVFLSHYPKHIVEQVVELPVIWNAICDDF